ncbi:MAG: Iron transporter [Gammaproteobacteria bacterium]|nr:Iron transporter [Gammaproteobacteria bacterium]
MAVAQGGALGANASGSELEVVTVTATRVGVASFDIPASISSVSGAQLRTDALGMNLSDDLATVPGLLARNRNNYAQDQQISIRGFGANSAFGIRGVRVYQDGIPATGPDGQGQVSQFNLDSAERVEILRGPFSALYGNSSGGVIQIFTADGKGSPQLRTTVDYGSFATFRAGANVTGAAGPVGYNVDFTHFSIDGYRDHSNAHNESFNGKVAYTLNDANRLTLVTNVVSRPDAQDPLGITQAQFRANPEQTDPAANAFNTRKSLQQQQGGLIYDLSITDAQSLRVLAYLGHRAVEQFLSIPASAQASPTSAGGVVNLNRNYGGADVRWSWQGVLADQPLTWVMGAAYDRQNELRRGYNNFVGSTLGVKGALRRNENDIVDNIDEYAQGTWDFAPLWSLMVGVRRSDVRFDSEDHFITASNPNDSGRVSYHATSPVAGLLFKARPWLHLYASYGQGFQTPLGSELAYRSDGGTGLNLGLKPARSNNGELGAKLRIAPDLNAEVAVFRALTHDEIVVNTNIGGRSTYQNSNRTRRQGLEASLDYRLARQWHVQLAYTYLEASYVDSYLTCVAAPCAQPTALVPAGSRLPGVPKNNVYASVRWGEELGWHFAVNGQYVSAVAVNDMNTVAAPAYATFGTDGGYVADLRRLRLSTFLRVNNLLNRHYVGSVIVDDGNGRYFEPGPGFNVLAGVSVVLK